MHRYLSLRLLAELRIRMNIFDDVLYELPKNWHWVELSAFLKEIRNGTTIEQNKGGKGFSVTRIESLQNQTIDFSRLGNVVNSAEIKEIDWYKPYDIVLSHINSEEHVGKTALITESMLPLVHGMNLLRLRFFDSLNPMYFQYYTQTLKYKDSIWRRMRRSVNQVSLNQKLIGSIEIPLPPIAEQEIIVKCLDSLLTKLDKAKAIAQNIIDGYELRRGKIVYEAFTGKLTNANTDDWVNVILTDVCKINPPKVSTKNLSDELEVTFVPMPSVSAEYGTIKEPKTRRLIEVKTGFTNFSEGDVIFAKITPCMENGKSAIVENLINGIGYGSTEFFVFRCGERLYNRFLYHLFRSKFFRDNAKIFMQGSVGQQRVPRRFFESYNLKLPTIEEQKEIVRRLDSLLTKEQQIKEIAENVLNNIKTMKKKILGMAFRGELINPKSEGFKCQK